ncbi:MAG: DUF1302 family protein [Steroidobacteraceae bacterium]|jgi:hypothetical protein
MYNKNGWRNKSILVFSIAAAAAMMQSVAWADEDFSWSGFIRSETAIRTTSEQNMFNQGGNPFNGVPVSRTSVLGTDTTTRDGVPLDNSINMQMFRGELGAIWKMNNNFSVQAKLRVLYDPGWYDQYNPNAIASLAQATSGGNPGGVYGQPNYFQNPVQGMSHPNPLEWDGQNYQIYFPALFLEFNKGPLDVRLGNQQIAWGQALFFRVFDVVDGLDLRRHSALDFASEEYSDKRVPSLALRTTYQVADGWTADGFVQKFQSTVYSNPNTPYNVIASQFTIHDLYEQYQNKLDLGLRLKGDLGAFGVQGMAVHRYNPDGVFRWTQSGVDRDLPGLPGTGKLLAQTPFEVDPSGVWSANEWFTYAGAARLNGVTALNSAVSQFPAAQTLGATVIPGNTASQAAYNAAAEELNLFFQLSGSGLRGHLAREYFQENDVGLGTSYVVSGSPGSFLDQLIINFEASYVPDRTFTNPSLSSDFIHKPETSTALVLEKYQRFSSSFPATYMVFQWMHKTESDLFGRYLGGMGGTESNASTGFGGGWNALAFAFQQPFPGLVWRFDFAALYDTHGGILVQPAIRWKPSGGITVETFYNYLNSHLAGTNNANNNIIGTLDFASEVGVRLGYQF